MYIGERFKIIDSEHCITIYELLSAYEVKNIYQIIKRIYPSIEEILIGFNLDSCAIAMVLEDYYHESLEFNYKTISHTGKVNKHHGNHLLFKFLKDTLILLNMVLIL